MFYMHTIQEGREISSKEEGPTKKNCSTVKCGAFSTVKKDTQEENGEWVAP